MKWSFRVGKLAGIDLKIHVTFLLILGWIGLVHWQAEGTASAVLRGIFFILALATCSGSALTPSQ